MFGKIFASIVLIVVLYILGIFLAPNLVDSIAESLGIMSINTTIRDLKSGADSTSDTLLQIKDASWVINSAREAVNKTVQHVETTKQIIDQKVEQVQKTAESIDRASQAISEVQSNLSELTTLSGVTSTGSTQTGTVQ